MNTPAESAQMSRTELVQRVQGIASDLLDVDPALLTDAVHFSQLGISRAAVAALVIRSQYQLSVQLDPDDMARLVISGTFGQLVDLIGGALGGK